MTGTLGYEPAVEQLHFAPLQLLAHVDSGGVEHARQVVHAAQRPPAVGLAEAHLPGKLEVARGVEAGAADGVLDKPERHLVDMFPISSSHPGDGAQPRGRVRRDEHFALPEIDAREVPAEEQLALLRGRQGAGRRHLPDGLGQSDLHDASPSTIVLN